MFILIAVGASTQLALAEGELSRYRTFTIGGTVASVLVETRLTPASVKTLHQRPTVLQELEWRPSMWAPGMPLVSTDPVRQILFSFADDTLYRIDVDYDSDRTAGMTNADMIEALSAIYGAPAQPGKRLRTFPPSRLDAVAQQSVAHWDDGVHVVELYRTASYGKAMRLTVTDPVVAGRARTAETRAVELDRVEAPQRERAREERAREGQRDADEKSRTVNKPVFRP
jgi:hypothetical protein